MSTSTATATMTKETFKRIEDVVVAIDFLVEEQVIGDMQSDLLFLDYMAANLFSLDEYENFSTL